MEITTEVTTEHPHPSPSPSGTKRELSANVTCKDKKNTEVRVVNTVSTSNFLLLLTMLSVHSVLEGIDLGKICVK